MAFELWSINYIYGSFAVLRLEPIFTGRPNEGLRGYRLKDSRPMHLPISLDSSPRIRYGAGLYAQLFILDDSSTAGIVVCICSQVWYCVLLRNALFCVWLIVL